MVKTEHVVALISRYVDEELSPAERRRVEEHLKECDDCRQLVREQQTAADLITDVMAGRDRHLTTEELIRYHSGAIESSWSRTLTEHHLNSCQECAKLYRAVHELDQVVVDSESWGAAGARPAAGGRVSRGLLPFLLKRRLVPALAVVALIVLVVLIRRPASNPYASLVQIQPASYVQSEIRGGGSGSESFRQGMAKYTTGDFAGALSLLQRAAAADSSNPQFQFFYGVTLLLNAKPRQALPVLTAQAVLESPYREEALWYAAQACLLVNRPRLAREYLEDLHRSSSAYGPRARALIQRMDQIGG